MNYNNFIEQKKTIFKPSGFMPSKLNNNLFDYQQDIVSWACQKGKAALFCGTGLGKTLMQLEWAEQVKNYTKGNVLILAPLAVAAQTVREGEKFGIKINHCLEQSEVIPGISITNYERLDKFNPNEFIGIVLDESSILKAQTGKTRTAIIDMFTNTPYKLACTATPAPNDHMELGNHAEFLGVMRTVEMLSMFFVHDGGDTAKWRLKGHAVKSFWEWVSSWAVMMTKPSDLGYSDEQFDLPELRIHQITVECEPKEALFSTEAQTLQERQQARRESLGERVSACVDIVNKTNEPFLIWCNLNSESELLSKSIFESVEVKGSDSNEHKENSMIGFSSGKIKRLISKPSICGFGMNWQHCSKMAFVGLSDSFEQYYQAVRRCWRFGQTKPVDVYVITAETEGAVVSNIERKERDFNTMLSGMISATQEITRKNIRSTERETDEYNPQIKMRIPIWLRGIS